jgi:hypothetical protein
MAGMPPGATFTGHAKQMMLEDFFGIVEGGRAVTEHRSLLSSHLLGSAMLTAAFESVASDDTVCRHLDGRLFGKAVQ